MPLVFLLYALFASVFVVGKYGLEYSQPLFLVGSRMMLAGALMLGYEIITKKSLKLARSTWFWLLQLALFNIYLTNALEFWGLQYLTAAKTCFIYSLSPFIAALFSYFIFSEVLTPKKWLGLIIGFLGFIPILMHHSAAEAEIGSFFWFSWPELALMGAATSSVYGWITLKKLMDKEVSPLTANGFSMLIGGGIALAHSSFVETWNPVPVTEYAPFLLATLVLICVSNFICYNLYGVLLRRFSATFMSFSGFSTPLFAALFGWLFLNEGLAWQFCLSLVIVFTGLFLFYQEELKKEERLAFRTDG